MRLFIKCVLFLTLIQLTIQQQQANSTAETPLSDDFSHLLNRLASKIHDQFARFKENVKGVFDREKRQNFDPILASSISGSNIRDNIGFRVGLQSSPNARVIDRVSNAALRVSQNIASRIDANTVQRNRASLQSGPQPGSRQQQQPVFQQAPQHNTGFDSIIGLQAPPELCPFKQVTNCDFSSKFRNIDGSCNNIRNPWWGKGEIPYKRYLKAEYSDGIQQPRVFSVSGNPLPNPRAISRSICTDNGQIETMYSHVLAIFGQFLAHDVTSVSTSTDDNGAVIDCPCGSTNPSCMSITVAQGDGLMQSSCIKFTRSSAAFQTPECRIGSREQLNIISSFIDGTMIYGTDDDSSSELRSHVGGQLKSSPGVNGRPFMQKTDGGGCRGTTAQIKCFKGGEGRTNENLGLLSLQTLFFREHNTIAQGLASVNPSWDDETLFQETRRTVVAILQHIAYSEYLPTLLGLNIASLFDLLPLHTDNYYTGYDENVNPSLANEFAAAAFRFGHTLIKNAFTRTNMNHQKTGTVPLGDTLFKPKEAYNAQAGGLETVLTGLLNDPAAKFDSSFADTLQNHLFEFKLSDGSIIAVDLAATNVNRGRDHGIPSYNAYRQRCGLKRAASFDDFADTIDASKIQKLAELYESPEDVDFYIGGLSERPSVGAVIGPVFGCLIASQFSDLKKGDRYFYENGPSEIAFTLPQLTEIRKMSFSRLLCDNTDIKQLQPNSFLLPNAPNNARVSCEAIPNIDLRAWASI